MRFIDKIRRYLSQNLSRQIGSLKEGHRLVTTDPPIPIQIRSDEVRIEHPHVRHLIRPRRHLPDQENGKLFLRSNHQMEPQPTPRLPIRGANDETRAGGASARSKRSDSRERSIDRFFFPPLRFYPPTYLSFPGERAWGPQKRFVGPPIYEGVDRCRCASFFFRGRK
ncbi:hypothetical protein B296_00034101 [Ensete ventricosum]|uniref:Uncharacterized protein n=1 Tax=Ensete ventricosum TaxID=4639 RepID=A0A427A7K8_ENSVE|nr:hypothetical protein B296_00034101 [Ensete ventricosum]